MKLLIWIVLLLIVCTQAFSHPCGGGQCCGGSSCTSCSLSCCNYCCNSKSSGCCNNKLSCCEHTTPCPSPETTTTPRPPYPTFPTFPSPDPQRSTPSSSISNNNNNNITIPTNIHIQNEIRSENHINVPVTVDVRNENNINIHQQTETSDQNCTDTSCEIKNNTIVVTVTVPVFFPVRFPVYQKIPVPYVVTIPRPVPVPVGCCQMVTPCSPYLYGGCQSSSMHCSHHCAGQYMYQASNVCNMGCYKRDTAMGFYCGHHGGCSRSQIDCSMCQGNFYQSYENFMMCSGCFLPMPWGMTG